MNTYERILLQILQISAKIVLFGRYKKEYDRFC